MDVKGELDDPKFDLEEENRDTVKQALRVRSAHSSEINLRTTGNR